MLHDSHHCQPGLLSSGENLIGGQDETVATSISQLKTKGVLDALVVGPVNGTAASLILEREKEK